MRALAIFALATLVQLGPTDVAHSKVLAVEPSARAIFAKHDRNGRFKWTKIKKLGDVHVGRTTYSIYNLSFVNYGAASLHGMQQVSIIRDGRIFVGSYLDVAEPAVAIRGRNVLMGIQHINEETFPRTSFTIGKSGPPQRVLLTGAFHTLENSI